MTTKKYLGISLKAENYDWLKSEAPKLGRSMSNYLDFIISFYRKFEEKREQGKL